MKSVRLDAPTMIFKPKTIHRPTTIVLCGRLVGFPALINPSNAAQKLAAATGSRGNEACMKGAMMGFASSNPAPFMRRVVKASKAIAAAHAKTISKAARFPARRREAAERAKAKGAVRDNRSTLQQCREPGNAHTGAPVGVFSFEVDHLALQ